MKIILLGSTGFIGTTILRRLLIHPSITTIITLSRRALPPEFTTTSTNPSSKLTNIIVPDFRSYTPEVLFAISGADACIWALGGRVPQFKSFEDAREANVVLTLEGARTMAGMARERAEEGEQAGKPIESSATATKRNEKKFRFVYCSGAFTEHDQDKKLWFLSSSRKLKGEAETGLQGIAKEFSSCFSLQIARPAGVLESDGGLSGAIYGAMGIGREVLAAAVVEMAIGDWEGLRKGEADVAVVESKELRKWGREILKGDVGVGSGAGKVAE